MKTHELKKIFKAFSAANEKKHKTVLASVVALEGSSYRQPGVRMLIIENGDMVGAVSGGCVEKEVKRQAQSVFEKGIPKVMTYDGRYRLGCEGVLFILIEPFEPSSEVVEAFWQRIDTRKPIGIQSHFEPRIEENQGFGSQLHVDEVTLPLRPVDQPYVGPTVLEQRLDAPFRLLIVGAEHDAVQLCAMAALMGWEVIVVAPPNEEKELKDFPGAKAMAYAEAETLTVQGDVHTAIILMTHSYVKDLKFLLQLKSHRFAYFGILGPARRREKLFHEALEHDPDLSLEFLESVNGPAGLDIGADTPQEIALSILAEILGTTRNRDGSPLKDKEGRIHA
ncbi:XdhC family protein [Flagellimonas sp. DF-77]|uniref:XdhC family protein n=1 Tax=Flagellimonas algarum TaxID=3230298 RepID=UPI00339B59F7